MESLDQNNIIQNLFNSGLIVLTFAVLRLALHRGLNKSRLLQDSKLEWKEHINTGLKVFVLLGLLVVWGQELQAFALSIVAFAVAVVIAMKELILCLLGGILKSMSRPFRIGDRIEIGDHRGDVIKHDLLTTTLFQIGPARLSHYYTGRRIVLPNSLLLSNALINETRRYKFSLHTFQVHLPADANVKAHREALLQAARNVCGQYQASAQQFLNKVSEISGIVSPRAEPQVSVAFSDGGAPQLITRVPIPALESADLEQKIIGEYLELRETINAGGTGVQKG